MERRYDGRGSSGRRSASQEKGRTRAGSQEKGRGSGRAESLDKVDSRPSVFSRLGNKVAGQAGNKGGNSGSTSKASSSSSRRQSLSPRKKGNKSGESSRPSSNMSNRKDSPAMETTDTWSQENLEKIDQLTLEKKREMLQRELARQLEADSNKLKRKRSKSSSSSNSSSSSGSDSNSSGSSSESNKKKKKEPKKKKKETEIDKSKIKKLKAKLKQKKQEKLKKKIAAKAKKIKTELKEVKSDKKGDGKTGSGREGSNPSSKARTPEPAKPRIIVKPGGQERDKFGFYIAPAPIVQPIKQENSRSRSRSPPERKERRKSGDRDKKRDSSPLPQRTGSGRRDGTPPPRTGSGRRDSSHPPRAGSGRRGEITSPPPRTGSGRRGEISPARTGSGRDKHRNSRDRSSSPARKQDKTDRRKSPHGKKSPNKRERSIKREKSPVGRNRSKDRTSAPRDRSPAGKKRSRDRSPGQGKDKQGGSRDRRDLNTRDRDHRGGAKDDRDHRGPGKDDRDHRSVKDDRDHRGGKDDLRRGIDEDRRRDDDKSSKLNHKDDRDRRDDKRHDRDSDLRGNPARRGAEERKGRDDDVGGRRGEERKGRGDEEKGRDRGGKEKEFSPDDRRIRGASRGKPGKGSEERVSAQERLGTRRGARDWDDRDEGGDSRDIDSRRQSWARGSGDSPRRLVGGGRGRAKLRRGSDRRSGGERGMERNDDVNGWKREGRPAARGKRKPSGPIGGRESAGGGKKDLFRPRSRQKSGGGGGEKLSRDLRDNLNAMEEDNSGDEKEKRSPVREGSEEKIQIKQESPGEGKEKIADDFSDFGESDDEILNQEEDEVSERTGSRQSNQSQGDKDDKDVLGQLGEGGDEDKMEGDDKGPEIGRENEKIADLLGVDWSQLMEQQDNRTSVQTGVARRNWTAPQIFRRIGLSKRYLGEETYNKILDQINKDLPEDEKVKLLDPVPGIHVAKQMEFEEDQALNFASVCSKPLALSAAMDMRMRRHLNGVTYPDHGPTPPPMPRQNEKIKNEVMARIRAARQKQSPAVTV